MKYRELNVPDGKAIAVFQVDVDARRGSAPVHHDSRARQLSKIPGAIAMVGVRMGVHDVLERKAMIRENREVTIDLFLNRVDDQRRVSSLGSKEIGLAIASVEITKEHLGSFVRDPAVIAAGELATLHDLCSKGND